MDINTAFLDLIETISELSYEDKIAFLSSILLEKEKKDITIRWAVLNDLANALSQRSIASKYSCSLQKVSNCMSLLKDKSDIVSNILQHRYDETIR